MESTNNNLTRTSVTGTGIPSTSTQSTTEMLVLRTLVLADDDMTEAALEARATEVGSVLEEILHHNPGIEHWGWGLNEC